MLAEWWGRVTGKVPRRRTMPTRFGEATVYPMTAEDGSLVLMLGVGGVLQSATYLDERWNRCPFAYLRAFDHLFEAAVPVAAPVAASTAAPAATPAASPTAPAAAHALSIRRVLMIGGAGFAYPKQLLCEHPGVQLDVVEIDPAMVELAREHFFLDRLEERLAVEGRSDDLRIFVEDGETFLRDGEGSAVVAPGAEPGRGGCARRGFARYDVIINDAFVGRDPAAFFASDEGIAAARKRLTPGGLLMANCVVEFTGDAMYQLFAQVERLRDHFAQVYVIDASDEQFGGADNYLVIATDNEYPFTNIIPYGD